MQWKFRDGKAESSMVTFSWNNQRFKYQNKGKRQREDYWNGVRENIQAVKVAGWKTHGIGRDVKAYNSHR